MSGIVERLLAAPEDVNPAIEMSRRVQEMARAGQLDPKRVKKMLPEIDNAVDAGERDLDAARKAFRDLDKAEAVASKDIPLGF